MANHISDKTGEKAVHKISGQTMTIIRSNGYYNNDVLFEDGTLIPNCRYDIFKKGVIKIPRYYERRIGSTNHNSQGKLMKIIRYGSSIDIDVQFEDGAIVTHKSYKSFKDGVILHPADTHNGVIGRNRVSRNAQKRIGEQSKANNNMMMTLIAYRRCNDIDVEFEDGVVVKHKSYKNFLIGEIGHPKYNSQSRKEDYMERTFKAVNGLSVKIVAYENQHNVTIEFEDGYVATRKELSAIKKGQVTHPFPYQVGQVEMLRPAYRFNGIGNFYCKCNKCGLSDIMDIQEIREHKCQKTQ